MIDWIHLVQKMGLQHAPYDVAMSLGSNNYGNVLPARRAKGFCSTNFAAQLQIKYILNAPLQVQFRNFF
jgi:hypothetical protein